MPTVVRPKDLRRVLVIFEDTVDNAALTPTLYTFEAQAIPSYNPTVESVKFLNGGGLPDNSTVELFLENDLSPGVVYDFDIAAFTGFTVFSSSFTAVSPNWPSNRQLNLWDIVPTINKAEDTSEHLQRFIMCLQDQLDTTLSAIDNWVSILDPDRAPEHWLDHMLRDLGNPFVFEDITEVEKRMLLRTLVAVYQLKGTDEGLQAAIRFFMGFESQIHAFRHSGSQLGNFATPISLIGDSFVLGAGGPYDFGVVVQTTDPIGRALTATERTRIQRLISVLKPANARLWLPIFVGLVSTTRVQIAGSTASVTISWRQTDSEPDNWRVYYRRVEPGASPLNTNAYVEVAGSVTSTTISLPIGTDFDGTVYYFVVVPVAGIEEWGFVSEEVRSHLAAPTGLAAVGGPRTVTLSWTPLVGATGYRVYKTTPPDASTPVASDFMFEVLGGATTFVDTGLLPGQSFNYSVTALIEGSEGIFTASVTGTSA